MIFRPPSCDQYEGWLETKQHVHHGWQVNGLPSHIMFFPVKNSCIPQNAGNDEIIILVHLSYNRVYLYYYVYSSCFVFVLLWLSADWLPRFFRVNSVVLKQDQVMQFWRFNMGEYIPGSRFTNMIELEYQHGSAWIITCTVGRNYLSIPKLQRLHRWSLGMDKQFHPTLYSGCNFLSMLGIKLIHVSKRNQGIQ